jgi:hypothetical protein
VQSIPFTQHREVKLLSNDRKQGFDSYGSMGLLCLAGREVTPAAAALRANAGRNSAIGQETIRRGHLRNSLKPIGCTLRLPR